MLRDYQKSFKEAALGNDTSKIDSFLPSHTKKEQLKRFSIYRNTIFLSLIETLSHTFPSVSKLVGEENFKIIAREFIKVHLPGEAHLSAYGGRFSEFISSQEQVIADVPYLANLAMLDWHRHLSYFSSDCDVLDMGALSTLKPEDVFLANLTLASSVFFLNPIFLFLIC